MVKQNFESHIQLAEHIERMAATGSVGNPHEWGSFLSVLNTAIGGSAIGDPQEINNETLLQNVADYLKEAARSADRIDFKLLDDRDAARIRKAITAIGAARTQCLELIARDTFI